MSTFAQQYLQQASALIASVDPDRIEAMAQHLRALRDHGGRLFILGVGGAAAHASHAVNDFRKICGIEAYAPTDNVSELSARANDDGWDHTFDAWLRVSRLSARDAVFVLSVGGGSRERHVSVNIVNAIDLVRSVGASLLGIVGRSDGVTAQMADCCIVLEGPPDLLTPLVEGAQAVLWHLLAFHPDLKMQPGTWEMLLQDASRRAGGES